MVKSGRILQRLTRYWSKFEAILINQLPESRRQEIVDLHVRSLIARAAPAAFGGILFIEAKARELNDNLNSDVNSIPLDKLEIFEKDLRSCCSLRGFSEEYTQSWITHRFRLIFTINWIQQLIKDMETKNLLALELGAESPVTDILKKYIPEVTWQNSKGDLRYPWQENDRRFDLILCTELIEHVSDLPDGLDDSFLKTGLSALLKECYRTLKVGGYLFITTPNAGSVLHLANALIGQPPWFYLPHVREYTVNEIIPMLSETGFQVERCQTIHCMTSDVRKDYFDVFKMLIEYKLQVENRGDDIFLLVKK